MDTTPIASLLTKPLDQISHDDRLLLLRELVDASAIKHLILPDDPPSAVMFLSANGVQGGEVCTVTARSYFNFTATRLVIMATQRAGSDRVTADRWLVRSAFASHRNLFPTAPHCAISGDAFALDDSPFAPVVMPPGVDFTMQVSHDLAGLADFRAILFGVPKRS